MLTLFSIHANAWTEEALVIGTEVMFRKLGDTGPDLVRKVLALTDEKLDRPSLATAWLSYIQRKPYNTDCFNHWRYRQKPIGDDTIGIHSNEDDLGITLKSLNKSIVEGTLNGVWPYNFGFKVFLTLYFEMFSPVHVTEYWDSQAFPGGDDSGRNFNIEYQNKKTNLHDYWDSACGKYTLNAQFTPEQWKNIDNEVTELIKKYPASEIESELDDFKTIDDIMEWSTNISIESVYTGVTKDKEISSEYATKCQNIMERRLALAAYSLASALKKQTVPVAPAVPAASPLGSSEIIAWGLLFMLAPLTVFLAWNFLQSKIKQD